MSSLPGWLFAPTTTVLWLTVEFQYCHSAGGR